MTWRKPIKNKPRKRINKQRGKPVKGKTIKGKTRLDQCTAVVYWMALRRAQGTLAYSNIPLTNCQGKYCIWHWLRQPWSIVAFNQGRRTWPLIPLLSSIRRICGVWGGEKWVSVSVSPVQQTPRINPSSLFTDKNFKEWRVSFFLVFWNMQPFHYLVFIGIFIYLKWSLIINYIYCLPFRVI